MQVFQEYTQMPLFHNGRTTRCIRRYVCLPKYECLSSKMEEQEDVLEVMFAYLSMKFPRQEFDSCSVFSNPHLYDTQCYSTE